MGEQAIPRSIQRAVILMYVGAGLSALWFVVGFVRISLIRDDLGANLRDQGVSQGQINNALSLAVAMVFVSGVVGAGLWIWMAVMNKRGENWSRILGTVFFGITSIVMLLSFRAVSVNPFGTVANVVTWLVGLVAVMYMWRPESAPHYLKRDSQVPEQIQ